jgi:cellulose synthase/poly-beta-1,6-N-acetylglucosamine synthase-like glycosyltransferase
MNAAVTVLEIVLLAGGAMYFSVCAVSLAGCRRRRERVKGYSPTVSVIVAARNAERTIGVLLDDLLSQDYPADRVEIVPVDDESSDGTFEIMRSRAARDSRVKPIRSSADDFLASFKKRAIRQGIDSSGGEIILTVDADCRVPKEWIRGLMEYFTERVELVAGEVRIEGDGLLAWMEILEFTGIQCMAAGLANVGFPITCNGANLAYRRSAFERVGGFRGIGGFVSGDDDLLMQRIARGNPSGVVFVTGNSTAVRVDAVGSLGEFIAKRSRWASKIRGYASLPALVFLSAVFLFFAAVPIGILAAMAGLAGYGALAAGYGMKAAGDALLAGYGVFRAGRGEILLVFPLAELLHVPYILGVTLNGFFGRFEWKGRRTGAHVSHADEGGR